MHLKRERINIEFSSKEAIAYIERKQKVYVTRVTQTFKNLIFQCYKVTGRRDVSV